MTTREIGQVQTPAGQIRLGSLPFGQLNDGTEVSVPIIVVNGRMDGPTVFMSAAIHGSEIVGTEIIRQVTREIVDPQSLRGVIVATPVTNPLAFRASRYLSPEDPVDPHQNFPGNPNGSLTQRLIHTITTELIRRADYIVDFHANPAPYLNMTAVTRIPDEDPQVYQRASGMAEAFGLTIVERQSAPGWSNHMAHFALSEGIPTIALHLEGWYRFDETAVQAGVRGTLNVLKYLKMLEGPVEEQSGIRKVEQRLYRDALCDLHTRSGGIVFMQKRLAEQVQAGAIVGVVRDLWGDIVEELSSPVNGYVLGLRLPLSQIARTGERVIGFARHCAPW